MGNFPSSPLYPLPPPRCPPACPPTFLIKLARRKILEPQPSNVANYEWQEKKKKSSYESNKQSTY